MAVELPPADPPWQECQWQTEQFYADGDQYFSDFIEALNAAQQCIVVATYIFNADALGQQIIDSLLKAQRRGVEIRVLFDGFGSLFDASKIAEQLEQQNIEVKIFHPMPWNFANHHRALRKITWLLSFVVCTLKINQRHHAKMCIIDGRELWSGSLNITTDHLSIGNDGRNFHDYGIRVTGTEVQAVLDLFNDFWSLRKPRFGRGLFKYHWNNITTYAQREKNRLIAEKLRQAQARIWIVNPYFSPPHSIIRALKKAADQGVEVRLLVPNKSDIGFFPVLTSTYYKELLHHKVRIFEYLPHILHAKLLIIDDFFLLGSTNFNHRSLIHDVEFDVVVTSEEATHAAEQQFRQDLTQSREITNGDLKLIGFRRFWGRVIWFLRYWL